MHFRVSLIGCECLSETESILRVGGSRWLTSKPCFSDGTHTSLFAAQSAWLAAENDEFELGEPGPTPEYRKRVTSLAPPPVALDMVLLAKRDTDRHWMREWAETFQSEAFASYMRVKSRALQMTEKKMMDRATDSVLGARTWGGNSVSMEAAWSGRRVRDGLY